MHWFITKPTNLDARQLADKHYSRITIGAREFAPPGRKMVLVTVNTTALWVTSWPYAQYVNRVFPDAWICTLFRNESNILSSELILQAVSATLWKYEKPPASGMITLVDASKIKSSNPGYCYKQAGFKHVGYTKKGLYVLQLLPCQMPEPLMPLGTIARKMEVTRNLTQLTLQLP